MISLRSRFRHAHAFAIGVLLVLLWLFLFGMVESRGPACSLGLGRPEVYLPYEGVRYGWPVTAVQVGQVACQGSPEDWTPKLFVAWHTSGVLIAGGELLVGGLLTFMFSHRFSKKHLG